MKNIADIRKDYKMQTLEEHDTDIDPVSQFSKWWHEATNSNIEEVNAMTLSTVNEDSRPSSRIVLLKGFNESGFVFYSNYNSHKGTNMDKNPHVSLVFFWKELERQVRVEGMATKTSAEESDMYFNSRPEGSKIGAWASQQSTIVISREVLEKNEKEFKHKFEGTSIPRPPHWGGYVVKPVMIEFWQGRPSRMHDRIQYSLTETTVWQKQRLAP